MGSLLSLTLMIFLSLALSPSTKSQAQGIKSARLLDLVIRDYTLKSYNKYFRTGTVKSVVLPENFSGIGVNTARFRCGSLGRYGARIKEFHLGVGAFVHPCVERVLLIRQNLGFNWSKIYYQNYELSGYKLVSPVLGLLAYNAGDNYDLNLSNPFEIGIQSRIKPIIIDFSNITKEDSYKSSGLIPLCVKFEHDGRVVLSNQVRPKVCAAMGHGHFGLVVESPELPGKRAVRRWRVVVVAGVGAALGAFLLSLVLIALCVKVKQRAKMEEMERRAYEGEALRVTMVGHARAHVAPGSRTNPAIEHGYRPPPS